MNDRSKNPSTGKSAGRSPDLEKRDAIIDAAMDCFTEYGFQQTSMDQVAKVAAVSKRTVYNHFESKDILFQEIVHRLKQRCLTASTFDYQSGRSLTSQLEEFGRKVIDFHCHRESRRMAAVIVPRLVQQPELGKAIFGDARFFEKELAGWLQLAVADRRIQCDNPQFAARQFLGLLESFVVWPQVLRKMPSPSHANRQQLARKTVQMFLNTYQV